MSSHFTGKKPEVGTGLALCVCVGGVGWRVRQGFSKSSLQSWNSLWNTWLALNSEIGLPLSPECCDQRCSPPLHDRTWHFMFSGNLRPWAQLLELLRRGNCGLCSSHLRKESESEAGRNAWRRAAQRVRSGSAGCWYLLWILRGTLVPKVGGKWFQR